MGAGQLTRRAVCWATDALVCDGTTVSALARHLGVDWHTLWDAIAEEAATRPEQRADAWAVTTLGVDQHIWRPSRHGATDRAITTMVDLTYAAARTPPRPPPGRRVLIRTDNAGCTHAVLNWMTTQRSSYSVGFTLPEGTPELLAKIPETVWAPIDAHDEIRDGAWVAELTGLLDLSAWPPSAWRATARTPRADRST